MYKADALEEFLSFSAFSKKKKIFQTFGITKFFNGPLGDIDCIYNAHVHRWIQHPVITPKMERFSKPLLALSYFRKTLHLRCLTGLPICLCTYFAFKKRIFGKASYTDPVNLRNACQCGVYCIKSVLKLFA